MYLRGLVVTLAAIASVTANNNNHNQNWENRLWNCDGHQSPNPPTNLKQCTVPHQRNKDDSPGIVSVFKQCNKNSEIIFEDGVAYNMWTPMLWQNLSNVVITMKGSLHLPNNITAVQQQVAVNPNPPSSYAIPWIYIQGDRVHLQGTSKAEGGAFHGYGQQWWDIGNRTLRPQLATFNVTNGSISKIKVIKPVAWGFYIPGVNVSITDHTVDAAPTNGTRDITTSFPFNTDGFNIGGQNISINGYYGHNGDDCVSVVNGANGVVAKNGYCGFSSHGLSIGSLGKGGQESHVANVLFQNWTMDGAVYGARFKSWTGGRGKAENVTYRDITTLNVSTPIFITQNYYDQDKGPRPNNTNQTSTEVHNFLFDNFQGYINPNPTDGTCISNPCWNYVAGADGTQAIIFDLYNGTATGITATNIHEKPYKKTYNDTTVICDPATLIPGEQDTLGFLCQRGPYVPTAVSD